MDYLNLAILFCGSLVITSCTSSVLQLFYFEELNFVGDKLPVKTAKFMSLKICTYTVLVLYNV